jgi:(p)ppGpp synthase/HD superfamily hydrolase
MDDENSTVVALLHDVMEDTPYTLTDLQKMGYPDAVLEALLLMTHDKNIPYMEYVKKIKMNPIARKVKLADLRHNSDLTRLNQIEEKDLSRVKKYKEAIMLLEA